MYKYPYLLNLTDKSIFDVLYNLGTCYSRINTGIMETARLYSEKFAKEEKVIPFSTYLFLEDIGFVDEVDHYLTIEGKNFFETAFILNDEAKAQDILKAKLQSNPVVNLIGQVFYGRGKIEKVQLKNLLNFHEVADWQIELKEINSLLILLNKYSILTYDKRNGIFYLKEPIQPETLVNQYFVNPTTPFSNIYNIRKAIRSCKGNIYWIDKHFRKEGLEMILDGLTYEGVNNITIISTRENITQSAKSDYEMLKNELQNRFITLNWRVIDDNTFKWHDRWIIADNIRYNIPPVLAILRGQRSDILKVDPNLEFDIESFISKSIVLE